MDDGSHHSTTTSIGSGESRRLKHKSWTRELAISVALQEGIDLTPLHWEVIELARLFFKEYQTSPSTRLLVKIVARAYGPEKGNSLYLHQLFPGGPAKQLAKIAGLPRPIHCV